jgi:hypothetical protein
LIDEQTLMAVEIPTACLHGICKGMYSSFKDDSGQVVSSLNPLLVSTKPSVRATTVFNEKGEASVRYQEGVIGAILSDGTVVLDDRLYSSSDRKVLTNEIQTINWIACRSSGSLFGGTLCRDLNVQDISVQK